MKIIANVRENKWLNSLGNEVIQKIKQMVVVLENFQYKDLSNVDEITLEMLGKLRKTHFLIHVHASNDCPDKLELTYLRRNKEDAPYTINKTPLPIPNLDYPNNPKKPDININDIKTIIYDKTNPHPNPTPTPPPK